MAPQGRGAAPGRQREAGRAAEEDALLLGVDVGATKIAAALGDLDGHLVARRVAPTWPDDGGPGGLDAVTAVIEGLLAARDAHGVPVRGLGVGVAGETRPGDGVVTWAPGLDWRELDLRRTLEERFGIPTFVENDVNLAALGEHWRGAGRGVAHLVGVFIGTGIGAGVLLDGRLLHGAHGAAGEIGYLLLDRAALDREYPGFGAFESLAAGPGIARRAVTALASGDAGSSLRANGPEPSTAQVFAAALAGDALARGVIDETVDYLALALASVACVLDPQRIVLGGSVGLALAPWHGALRERLRGRVPHPPDIVPAALGVDAGLLGAIALAHDGVRNAECGMRQRLRG
jgi:predicted NBD/HSP70 family sugar kinase